MTPDLTLKDVMARCNCSRQAARNLLYDHGIRFYRLSSGAKGRIRIPTSELDHLSCAIKLEDDDQWVR